MRCEEIDSYVYPYLDGEFEEQERAEFEAHLLGCAKCRSRVEMERWLLQQVHSQATQLPMASAELRERISLRLGQLCPAAGGHRSAGAVPGFIWKPLPAIFGLGALAFFLWPMLGSSLDPLVQELVTQHEQETGVDVAGPEAARLHRFYSTRLPFALHLPRFASHESILLGGRVERLANRPSARVVYDVNGEKVTLVVFQGDASLGGRAAEMPEHHWIVQGARGHSVAIYRSSGVTYGITSRMELPKLEQMVHQASFTP